MGRYRVTVDTGGTFSDFVYLNEETDEVSVAKLPSTPDDPSRAPRWMSRNSGMIPTPSGRMRHNSSTEPGRMVGLILPTTPRQDVKAKFVPSC